MKAWTVTATLMLSLVLIVGIQTGAFADSGDGSKSCPFKGDKSDYNKNGIDYSEKHSSDKVSEASLGEQQLPSWLKSNAKWWASGQLNDNEFASGIKFLIEQDVITITNNESSHTTTSELQTPHWIKNTAGWWADGLVSDTEFVEGLEHLVNNGVI
ncbi:MAG: hypothetical protein OEQ12_08045 [Nitrosopumilus sp.]|nr:hypothetical protein [Nitrosopumilus sp.]